MTTILIVDDHPTTRSGLRTVIETDENYQIVGEAGNFKNGRMLAKKIQPDIAVVDIRLPDRDGIELTKEIVNFCNKTKVMIVSVHNKPNYIIESFRAGAKGYVKKDSSSDLIHNCLDSIIKGQVYIDETMKREYNELAHFLKAPAGKETECLNTAYGSLTRREQEVFRALAENRSVKDISEAFIISQNTVRNHRKKINKKLGIKNDIELVYYAVKAGIIDTEDW